MIIGDFVTIGARYGNIFFAKEAKSIEATTAKDVSLQMKKKILRTEEEQQRPATFSTATNPPIVESCS